MALLILLHRFGTSARNKCLEAMNIFLCSWVKNQRFKEKEEDNDYSAQGPMRRGSGLAGLMDQGEDKDFSQGEKKDLDLKTMEKTRKFGPEVQQLKEKITTNYEMKRIRSLVQKPNDPRKK